MKTLIAVLLLAIAMPVYAADRRRRSTQSRYHSSPASPISPQVSKSVRRSGKAHEDDSAPSGTSWIHPIGMPSARKPL